MEKDGPYGLVNGARLVVLWLKMYMKGRTMKFIHLSDLHIGKRVNGFSVLEVLQREKMDPDIPVIATGPQNEAMEDRAMELGADDFAGRPHSQKSLRRRVLRAIHAKAPRERAARPGQILTLGED